MLPYAHCPHGWLRLWTEDRQPETVSSLLSSCIRRLYVHVLVPHNDVNRGSVRTSRLIPLARYDGDVPNTASQDSNTVATRHNCSETENIVQAGDSCALDSSAARMVKDAIVNLPCPAPRGLLAPERVLGWMTGSSGSRRHGKLFIAIHGFLGSQSPVLLAICRLMCVARPGEPTLIAPPSMASRHSRLQRDGRLLIKVPFVGRVLTIQGFHESRHSSGPRVLYRAHGAPVFLGRDESTTPSSTADGLDPLTKLAKEWIVDNSHTVMAP